MNWLGHYARVVDHLVVKNVAQGAPLGGGGSTLHPQASNMQFVKSTVCIFCTSIYCLFKKIEPFAAGSPVVSLNVQIGFMTH